MNYVNEKTLPKVVIFMGMISMFKKPMNYALIAAVLLLIAIIGASVYYFLQNSSNSEIYLNRDSARTYQLDSAFAASERVNFYNLGESRPNIGIIYLPVSGFDASNNPIYIQNRSLIFSYKKSDPNYSDFWFINYVVIPQSLGAEEIKSAADIQSKNLAVTATDIIVNQPQVSADDKINPERDYIKGWADGTEVSSWLFDGKIALNNSNMNQVNIGKVYYLVQDYRKVGNGFRITNQKNVIFSSLPSDQKYSPLTELILVKVPANFSVDSFESEDDVLNSEYSKKSTGIYLNSPILPFEMTASKNINNNSNLEPAKNENSNSGGQIAFENSNGQSYNGEMPNSDGGYNPNQNMPVYPPEQGGYYNNQNLNSGSPQTEVTPGAIFEPVPEGENIYYIEIKDLAFNPTEITIPKGASVVWVNNDNTSHTVTSADDLFGSTELKPGAWFKVDFIISGKFLYFCQIHPEMKGTVTSN